MTTQKDAIGALTAKVAELQRELGQLTGSYTPPEEPEVQADHVEHGSDNHAALLGLKKAQDYDKPKLDDWALEDIVSWGPTTTQEFLENTLRGKVNELSTPFLTMQSKDPLAPHFAPAMWRPGKRFAQITE